MRRHETLEERARGSRVLFVVLALVMAASLVGFLGGLAEEHVAVAPPPPPPADAPRRHRPHCASSACSSRCRSPEGSCMLGSITST